MRRTGLTAALLREVAEALEVFSRDTGTYTLSPPLAILAAIVAACATSFTRSLTAYLAAVVGGAALSALTSGGLKSWLRPVAFALFISVPVSAPLLLLGEGRVAAACMGPLKVYVSLAGAWEALFLVLRVTSAAAIFSAITIHLGWRGLLEGLLTLRAPVELVEMVGLFFKYTPMFVRDLCTMVAAREARLVGRCGYRLAWASLASAVGEILLRSYRRAVAVSMAMRARCFGARRARNRRGLRLSRYDPLLILVLLFTVWLAIAGP